MFCAQCGSKLSEDAAFCSNCGNPVARRATISQEPIVEETVALEEALVEEVVAEEPVVEEPVVEEPVAPEPVVQPVPVPVKMQPMVIRKKGSIGAGSFVVSLILYILAAGVYLTCCAGLSATYRWGGVNILPLILRFVPILVLIIHAILCKCTKLQILFPLAFLVEFLYASYTGILNMMNIAKDLVIYRQQETMILIEIILSLFTIILYGLLIIDSFIKTQKRVLSFIALSLLTVIQLYGIAQNLIYAAEWSTRYFEIFMIYTFNAVLGISYFFVYIASIVLLIGIVIRNRKNVMVHKQNQDLSLEQTLLLLRQQFEAGQIGEPEYSARRAEIISKL